MPALGRPDVPAPAGASSPPPKPKEGLKEMFSGIPGWGWIFVAACLALPVVNLGGAIPGALGFGGAAACANVAKKADWHTPARVFACAAIAGGIWFLWMAAAVLIVSLRG